MVFSDQELVAEIVMRVCDTQAPRFRSDPKAIYGAVFQKVVENAARQRDPLRNPNGFIHKTACFESRRACRRERAGTLLALSELDELTEEGRFRRASSSSVLDLLAHHEAADDRSVQAEAMRVTFLRLPRNQQEALLVVKRAKGYEIVATDLPDTVEGLAKLRGCSRTHIYNLSNRAMQAIRASIPFQENSRADRS